MVIDLFLPTWSNNINARNRTIYAPKERIQVVERLSRGREFDRPSYLGFEHKRHKCRRWGGDDDLYQRISHEAISRMTHYKTQSARLT